MKAKLGLTMYFEDFLSKRAFCLLQDRFIERDKDIHLKMYLQFEGRFGYSTDEIDYDIEIEVDYREPYFPSKWVFKNVLEQNLEEMAERYMLEFERLIEEKGIYGLQQKADFAKHEIGKLPEVESTMKDLDYELLPNFKNILLDQYLKVLNYLNQYITDSIKSNDRLNFKLKRNDVVLLFFLLQQYGCIESCERARLGSLLDNLFNYQVEDGVYEPIKGSRKLLSPLHSGGKDLEKSYERLKEIFTQRIQYEPFPLE